jgi:hypothetical protein
MPSTDLMATGSRDVNGVYKFDSGTIWLGLIAGSIGLLLFVGFGIAAAKDGSKIGNSLLGRLSSACWVSNAHRETFGALLEEWSAGSGLQYRNDKPTKRAPPSSRHR